MSKFWDLASQGRDWLDGYGKRGWIAAMVLAFIFFWPLGLVVLFYMIGSGRMACKHRNWGQGFSRMRGVSRAATGNAAFDEYRDETLKRLEDEQTAFMTFMEKLRRAKDKAEFDQFMADRGRPDADGPVSA